MTADTVTVTAPVEPTAAGEKAAVTRGPPASPLILRWLFLAAATLLAFHDTVRSLIDSTIQGSLNSFIWLIPIAAAVAATAVARRERTELPIHDRQTDIILGILGLGFALMLHAVLLQRYSAYFHLLRIDLAALWFFLVSSSIVLFGLRPVVRFAWVWLLLLMGSPLGYQLAVIVFGGNRASAGAASLVIAMAATAVAVGRTFRRAVIGAFAAMGVGLPVLAALAVAVPNAPLPVFQLVPAVTAMVLAGLGMYLLARRGVAKHWLDRSVEPVAVRQIWAGIPVVLGAAIALSLVSLPIPAGRPNWIPGVNVGQPLRSPLGWHQTEQIDYPWVRRIYGRDADLLRQRFVADTGDLAWDKFGRPRVLVVDSTITHRPFSLLVYPSTILYDESGSRFSDPVPVDLGHGITGSVTTVVDDKRLVTANLLTWTWREAAVAQRVMVAAVDNHDDQAVFPEPHGGVAATLRTMFSMFFRGNQATWDSDPTYKDLKLLTAFGTALVQAQLDAAAGPT